MQQPACPAEGFEALGYARHKNPTRINSQNQSFDHLFYSPRKDPLARVRKMGADPTDLTVAIRLKKARWTVSKPCAGFPPTSPSFLIVWR
jgi:hypothetical protein